MKETGAIVIALLLVIGLSACAGYVDVVAYPEPADEIAEPDPPTEQEEMPTPLVEAADIKEPEELPPPAPVEEPIYIPVYLPPEAPPATLAEAFAAVVYRFVYIDGFDERNIFPRYSFSLMDIDLDGEPELIVHAGGGPNGSPWFYVFNKETAMEFIYLPGDEVSEFLFQKSVNGWHPMRFYQNDQTGEVIFSSNSIGLGGAIVHWVTYTDNSTFDTYRVMICAEAGWGSHFHALWDDSRWWPWADDVVPPIAEIEVGPCPWDANEPFHESCHIYLEGDSPAPTIVQLVNLATEGFTEIPVPEKHEFDGDYEWFFRSYVEEIQDWIRSIVGQES